ncbi:Protein CBR-SRA-1 [Caenorhabditis briggsae]|nr:Protein CBR-SRA-1 [Caenorhabditis briggsae]CAP36121.2 Protein CBR-SRA-1 [Caenorhabditis briggsae]
MVYKGFFLTDQPCEWLITESDCVPYTVLLYAGISGMFYSQTGVLIERGIATFASNYTTALSRRIGVTISTVVVLLSFITYRTIMWDDPLDGYVLTCFVPSAHSAHRANWFLFICVCLTFFNLIASMAVMYYNKVLEYR